MVEAVSTELYAIVEDVDEHVTAIVVHAEDDAAEVASNSRGGTVADASMDVEEDLVEIVDVVAVDSEYLAGRMSLGYPWFSFSSHFLGYCQNLLLLKAA